MQTAILTLHVVVCLVLVVLVLLQAGREGMGVIFGGGGNTSVFGSAGAGGVLVKLTAFLAVLFIVTSVSYNLLTSSGRDKGSSVLDVQFEEVTPPPATSMPEAPAAVSPDAPTTVESTPPATESSAPAAPSAETPVTPEASSSAPATETPAPEAASPITPEATPAS